MQDYELIMIVYGIISIITLVTFFIMAWNISVIKNQLKKINEVVSAYAVKDELMYSIECPYCQHEFDSFLKESYVCPNPVCGKEFSFEEEEAQDEAGEVK